MSSTAVSAPDVSVARSYIAPSLIFGAITAWLFVVTRGEPAALAPSALVRPMLALFALTAVVWAITLVVRNAAVIRGVVSIRYFVDLETDRPDERLERPARTFDNLMQAPPLFYVVCILMLVTQWSDQAQLTLAWTFVALRAAHAAIYIAVNSVPYRFAAWASSFVVLCLIWYRFAVHAPFS
jgi:hypothetical protein